MMLVEVISSANASSEKEIVDRDELSKTEADNFLNWLTVEEGTCMNYYVRLVPVLFT